LSQSAKFYAVKNGRVPGIYTDWPSAQEQITGWQKPKHRCFTTRAEAQGFLDEDTPKSADTPEIDTETMFAPYALAISPEPGVQSPLQKKAKIFSNAVSSVKSDIMEYKEEDYEAGTGPLPPGADDGFDPNIILSPETGTIVYKTRNQRQATKPAPTGISDTGPIRIHTDGSSLGNGTVGAFAGIGVWFGPGDPR